MAAETPTMAFAPAHPGAILREDILPNIGMTVTELAAHLGVSRQALSGLLNERRSVSLEMAQKLGQAFQNGTRFWLALQMQHDIWWAERGEAPRVAPIEWHEDDAA
ncbi:HigA family addiction module antitoxin [Pseudoroseicyclus tamaricis]|uniref:HigA family addiction module antidote protein n=1 Tax=Pseudoroseicyclus tamaricis TaxID=2705421 RepID=A0A6B2JXD6_9RHOB|nr:HigA family addiction module antitoxin [Pseudoroseicyclus tamaricis]NDV02790.1 HigA family addiction module antidote protein [Pseudoroseicyclus tamaricis]